MTEQRKPTLAIVLQGGVVQAIVSDDPKGAAEALHDVLIIDYDANGEDATHHVPQGDGTVAEAWVYGGGIERADIPLDRITPIHTEAEEEASG